MTDPLTRIWPLLDVPTATVSARDVETWPAGVHQKLVALGFLRELEPANTILCPECQNHLEEVIAIPGPGGRLRYVIHCPDGGAPRTGDRRRTANLRALREAVVGSELGIAGPGIQRKTTVEGE